MVVAENRLSTDLVQAGLNSHATTWPTRMLHYQDARGIEELRTTLASMLQHTFMKSGGTRRVAAAWSVQEERKTHVSHDSAL